MLSMIIIFDYVCTRVHLDIIVICTDGAIIDMCPCLLLVCVCGVSLAGHVSLVLCVYVNIK